MRRILPFLAVLPFLLAGDPSAAGQDSKAAKSKSTQETPAAADKTEAPALGGYCPVAYVAMNQAMKGDPKLFSVVDGHRYLFANADAKKMFDAAPAKYHVAYDGWCATAMSMGKKTAADPTVFVVSEVGTFLFSSEEARKMWAADPAGLAAKADAQWAKLEM